MSELIEIMPAGKIPQNGSFHHYAFNGPELSFPNLELDPAKEEDPSIALAKVLLPKYSFGLSSLLITGPHPSTLLSINSAARSIVGQESWHDFQTRKRSGLKSGNLSTVRDFGLILNNQMMISDCPEIYSGPFFTKNESLQIVKKQVGSTQELMVGSGNVYHLNRNGSMPAGNLLAAGISCGLLKLEAEKNGLKPESYNRIIGNDISSFSIMRSALLLKFGNMLSQGQNNFRLIETRDLLEEMGFTEEIPKTQLSSLKGNMFNSGLLIGKRTEEGDLEINEEIGLLFNPFRKALNTYNNLISTEAGQNKLKEIFEHPFNSKEGFNLRHQIVRKVLKEEFSRPLGKGYKPKS